jgi:hypothetical protein
MIESQSKTVRRFRKIWVHYLARNSLQGLIDPLLDWLEKGYQQIIKAKSCGRSSSS